MRKANQEITEKLILEEILLHSSIVRIGMIDEKGLPYILPFNYGYKSNEIYIHCANRGKKIDLLAKNNKVCFEVEQQADLVRNEKACKWTTTYRSIVGYGNIRIITDMAQKQKGLAVIMSHYGAPELTDFEPKQVDSVLILKLTITSLSGKQSGNWDKLYNQESFTLRR